MVRDHIHTFIYGMGVGGPSYYYYDGTGLCGLPWQLVVVADDDDDVIAVVMQGRRWVHMLAGTLGFLVVFVTAAPSPCVCVKRMM